MESQNRELSQRAPVGGPENVFVTPEENRPVLPADLLNLNDAEMAQLFEPGRANSDLLESYSYQDMQDIVTSNPDLINESFESLIQDLDELSQPESFPIVIKEESKINPAIFFMDNTKLKVKTELIHPETVVNFTSQNILSAGIPFPYQSFVNAEVAICPPIPPEHFAAQGMLKSRSNGTAVTSFICANEGKVNCKVEIVESSMEDEDIELTNDRIDSTLTGHSVWAVRPACNDQTVSSSKSLCHPQLMNDKDKNVAIVAKGSDRNLENGPSSSLLGITSSSPDCELMKNGSNLDLKVQEEETVSRKLSCDSSSIFEDKCENEEQVLEVMESILGEVETTSMQSSSVIASTCNIKSEVLDDSSETIKCPHKCGICSHEFTMLTNFSHHQSSHTRKYVFCCDPCDLVFASDDEVLAHYTKLHNYSNGYLCKICSVKLPTYSEFLQHCGSHSEEEPFECGECHLKFWKFNNFCLHMFQHTGELIFKCIVCTSLFRSKEDLFSHQKFFHSPDVVIEENNVKQNKDTFQCEACGKQFDKIRAMQMHKTVKHKVQEANIQKNKSNLCCTTCRKSFATVKIFKTHMAAAHHRNTKKKPHRATAHHRKGAAKNTNKQSTFQCVDCGKIFHSRAVYSRHVLSHEPKARQSSLRAKFQIKVSSLSFREVKFLCEFCCDPFHRAADLKKHIESVHPPVKEKVIGPQSQRKAKRRISSDSAGSHSASASATAHASSPPSSPIKVKIEQVRKDGFSADLGKEFQVVQESNEVWINVNNNMLRGIKAEGSSPKQLEDATKLIRQECVKSSSNDESVLYFCTQCSLSYKNIFELIQHKQLHPLPFLCPTCGLSYLIESDLINHICVF